MNRLAPVVTTGEKTVTVRNDEGVVEFMETKKIVELCVVANCTGVLIIAES